MRTFPFVPFLFLALTSPGQEGVIHLSLQCEYKVVYGQNNTLIQFKGDASLFSDNAGRIHGEGTMSYMENLVANSTEGKSIMKGEGTGSFQVNGNCTEEYLTFTISGLPIEVAGTSEMIVYADGSRFTSSYTSSFRPSLPFADGTAGVSVARQNGTYKRDFGMAALGLTGTIDISLSGINSAFKPPIKDIPTSEEAWQLEGVNHVVYTLRNDKAVSDGKSLITYRVVFQADKKTGNVDGKGTFKCAATGQITKPAYMPTQVEVSGSVRIKGKIKNDTLRFWLSMGEIKGNLNNDISLKSSGNEFMIPDTNEVVMPFENNAQVEYKALVKEPEGLTIDAAITWTLTGKKLEKWKVVIDDHSSCWTMYDGGKDFRCGSLVHVQRVIDVVIENGQFKEGEGRARFVNLVPSVNPPGYYESNLLSEEIIGSGADMEAERYDQVRHAKRFNPPLTEHDSRLKEMWLQIGKNNTPYLFPTQFIVKGIKKGNSLTLILPLHSGYAVSIRCLAVYKKDSKPRTDVERVILDSRFDVILQDGWEIRDPQSHFDDMITVKVYRIE